MQSVHNYSSITKSKFTTVMYLSIWITVTPLPPTNTTCSPFSLYNSILHHRNFSYLSQYAHSSLTMKIPYAIYSVKLSFYPLRPNRLYPHHFHPHTTHHLHITRYLSNTINSTVQYYTYSLVASVTCPPVISILVSTILKSSVRH